MQHPLIQTFKEQATIRGDVYSFASADAMTVISAASREGYRVLGLDGFFMSPDATEPSLENSIDYSADVTQGTDMNEAALRFVKERADRGLYFEIVLTRGRADAEGDAA